jgi:hypothetical protein|nr:MAG TPA: hypothetical protein [Caudoviricetes sp.]
MYISFGGDITLSKEDIDKAIKEVLLTLKKELPEEALTVEVLEYIANELKDKAHSLQIRL